VKVTAELKSYYLMHRPKLNCIMDVVVLDAHPEEDARIKRHVKYLIDQGLDVYRIHYNSIDGSAKSGVFSQFGEKGFRVNMLFSRGKIRTLYCLTFCLRRKILTECLKALETLNFDPRQPSIIHVHDPQLLPLAGMLIRNGLPNSKVIYDRHEIYEQLDKHPCISIPALYEKLGKNSISGVVIVSEHHANMTRKLFPRSYIVTVPNYPMSSIYDKNITDDKIKSFNAGSQVNAIYIGGLNNLLDRDVDLLIKIADETLPLYSNVNFMVGGTYLDTQSKVKIDALSKKYADKFHFLGYVPREETIKLTQKAHIGFFLLRPDTYYWVKASPNKVFEYLMCGTVPVIRADVDHADALHECSLIFNRSDDGEVIIKAVLDLLDNPERLKGYMEKAKELSVNYTWESVAVRYIELYSTLLYPEICPNHPAVESPLIPKGTGAQ
jgi:glycosyltransferase involved in cell wall biosynthesis